MEKRDSPCLTPPNLPLNKGRNENQLGSGNRNKLFSTEQRRGMSLKNHRWIVPLELDVVNKLLRGILFLRVECRVLPVALPF